MKANPISVILSLLLVNGLTCFGQTKTWTGGGDGVSWNNAANWSGGTLPGPGNDVVITGGAGTLVAITAADVTVRSIQCTKAFRVFGKTLNLTGGASSFSGAFFLTNNAGLSINGPGATVTAGSTTVVSDSDLVATGGGVISFPNLTSITNSLENPTWMADGAGSRVDLSAVTSLTEGYYHTVYINANNGGRVDLHRVAAVVGQLQVNAQGGGSVVDLSGMTGRWTGTGSGEVNLRAQAGSSILIPNVTQFDHASLRIEDTGVIPTAQLNLLTNCTLTVDGSVPNFGRLTNIDDTDLIVLNAGKAVLTNVARVSVSYQNPTWEANGAGSLLDLSSVTTVNVGYYKVIYLHAYAGGAVDLHRVAAVVGQWQVNAQDDGSLVDLSGMTGRWTGTGSGEVSLRAQAGPSILIPNVTQFDHASLRIEDTGVIPTAQLNLLTNCTLTVDGSVPNFGRLTNIDDTDLIVLNAGKAVLTNVARVSVSYQNPTWEANGAGSLLDLSSVTTVNVGYYKVIYLHAYAGGAVDLHRVAEVVGQWQVNAQDDGSVVDLSGMTGRWTGTGSGEVSLRAQAGSSILIPNVTQFDHASLRIEDTGAIPTAQLNLLTNCTLTVDGSVPNFGRLTNIDDTDLIVLNGGKAVLTNVARVSVSYQNPTWEANGAGSLLDLSRVTTVNVGYYKVVYLHAYAGGAVDLHRVAAVVGQWQVNAQDDGSLVDLSGMTGRWRGTGSGEVSLRAQAGSSILIPNVTQFDHASLRIEDTGAIPTAQLNLLTNCTLTVDGSVPNFGRLTNIDDTDLIVLNGGKAVLTNVARVSVSYQNPTWEANGAGSLLDLSSVTTVNVGYYKVVYLHAYAGGKVDLHGLASFSTGPVQLIADGTGSVIDLRGLSSFISTGSGSSSLTARNGGVILFNDQAFLLANVTINIPPGNAVLPPTLAASPSLTLYGQAWHSYWIEKRDTRSDSNPWVLVGRVPLTNSLQVVTLVASSQVQYRVWEFTSDPPLLDLFAVPNNRTLLVIYDTPSKTNQLLTTTSMTEGATWQPGNVTVMTNSFRIIGPTPVSDLTRFFRAKRL